MKRLPRSQLLHVHCRVGSLEKQRPGFALDRHVHCRVGSLEIESLENPGDKFVHCRVGSLETEEPDVALGAKRSLPRRQLRNEGESAAAR